MLTSKWLLVTLANCNSFIHVLCFQDEIGSSDNEKIKEAIVEMVHSLFIEAEVYTTHSTFSSFKGGFKFALNGIQIYKVKGFLK